MYNTVLKFIFIEKNMKKSIKFTAVMGVLFSFILLVGCSSKKEIEYRTIDSDRVEALNSIIEEQDLSRDKEIAYAYRPKDEYAEGNYTYEISSQEIKGITELTIKEEGANDDSINGTLIVMEIEKKEDKVKVLNIKEAYKCWPNRGHEEWGPEFCN